jgi:hypothetical protein
MSAAPDLCCEAMEDAVVGWKQRCREHAHAYECPDALIYVTPGDEHGIIVHDGGTSHVAIHYCPWCGADLHPGLATLRTLVL